MTTARVRVRAASYVDSVRLMGATRAMRQLDGVRWTAALMGTDANRAELHAEGFDDGELAAAGPNDLVLAVRADDDSIADHALDRGEEALEAVARSADEGGATRHAAIRDLHAALGQLPSANVAIVSVPGQYAALEAHKALSAGLHVLLFSDNVPVADEIALKRRAAELGYLVMGPGAGTAALAGTGLGFANAVRGGPVGVVAAAGTGAQEVMTLLDRWGAGVSHVVGVGGRDLSAQVSGCMTGLGLKALEADPGTEMLLIVSKPPDREVAERLLNGLAGTPTVAALLGLDGRLAAPDGVEVAATLEGAVLEVLRRLGVPAPDPTSGLVDLAAGAVSALGPDRTAIRGLFSGGTLCYETLCVVSRELGPVYSNTPIRPEWGLPAPEGAHVCLDLGEEEFTRGRPHPMLDPAARVEPIVAAGGDPRTGVVVLDVVLGYGAHEDPASVLAPACARISADVAVVAYVLGTDQDPQDRGAQCARMEEAGCLIAPTATRAALLAAAIASRRPELAAASSGSAWGRM
ncbi:MAG: protein FdrA [Egibacteraceae bacterium]